MAQQGIKWLHDSEHPTPTAEWKQDGFTLRATFAPDDENLGYLGTFSNDPEPGAIHHSDDPRCCEWFNPANHDPDHPENAQADYERALGLENEDWHYGGIVVKAVKPMDNLKFNGGIGLPGGYEKMRDDIILGSAALWGIESDSEKRFFTETAMELADEALDEAKQTLAELIAS